MAHRIPHRNADEASGSARAGARRRPVAVLVAGVIALTACGGGGDGGSGTADSGAAAGEQLPSVADAVDLDPAADLDTNLMPDIVVDHLNNRNKVNLRNYMVNDKPTLLWMWAPH